MGSRLADIYTTWGLTAREEAKHKMEPENETNGKWTARWRVGCSKFVGRGGWGGGLESAAQHYHR